jgi:glycosyltransferase involved in cell wall biosynthesis
VSRGPIRVSVVMDHPAQHFARALQLLSLEPGVDLKVHYWTVAELFHDPGFGRPVSWDVDLLSGYRWVAPPPRRGGLGRLCSFISQMRVTRPEVVLCYGWASLIARASIVYCLLTGTRLLLYGDTTWQHSSGGRHRWVRAAALRLLMHLCSGAVSTGTFNREFYISYGMNPRLIWPGVCPADTEMFSQARSRDFAVQGTGDGALRIGFAGKLITRKGVDELLHGLALLPRTHEWSALLIGDGPLMEDLRALAIRLNLDDRVVFLGFANSTEMPKLLAGCDVVVVPSRLDLRVLTTIEAMAAGAAIVVSDATAVWGVGDLVEDGVTGLVYRSGDASDLARQLSRLLEGRDFMNTLRRLGAERSLSFGPQAYARTVAFAVRQCRDIRG